MTLTLGLTGDQHQNGVDDEHAPGVLVQPLARSVQEVDEDQDHAHQVQQHGEHTQRLDDPEPGCNRIKLP